MLTNEDRKKIYKREHYRCAICDTPDRLQIHHILHKSQGGKDLPHNLIALCWRCHATAHGTRFPGFPFTKDDMEQAITEYMADLFADFGYVWNPWAVKLERIDIGSWEGQTRQAKEDDLWEETLKTYAAEVHENMMWLQGQEDSGGGDGR